MRCLLRLRVAVPFTAALNCSSRRAGACVPLGTNCARWQGPWLDKRFQGLAETGNLCRVFPSPRGCSCSLRSHFRCLLLHATSCLVLHGGRLQNRLAFSAPLLLVWTSRILFNITCTGFSKRDLRLPNKACLPAEILGQLICTRLCYSSFQQTTGSKIMFSSSYPSLKKTVRATPPACSVYIPTPLYAAYSS